MIDMILIDLFLISMLLGYVGMVYYVISALVGSILVVDVIKISGSWRLGFFKHAQWGQIIMIPLSIIIMLVCMFPNYVLW